MNRIAMQPTRTTRMRRRIIGLLLLAVLIIAGLGLATGARVSQPGPGRKWIPTQTPPGTEFAGTAACAECHRDHVTTYQQSPMSAALEMTATAATLRANRILTFRDGRFSFTIRRDGDRSIYSVTDGETTISEPILFSFGQGQAGQTYILQHDGNYYESRVSYYREPSALDLTIGYRETRPRTALEALGRRLTHEEVGQCFSCHATNAVSHSRLQLERLVPGVTCESCHGPGGEHIAAEKAGRPGRTLIYNPHRSVASGQSGLTGGDEISQEFCGACHRSSEQVMTRNAEDGTFNVRFQPYRLFGSRCYSDDQRIGCISCHNPHESLKKEPAHYDARCQSCHQNGPARGGAPLNRTAKTRDTRPPACRIGRKNCTSCHMPKVDLPGAHFRFTDHRIRIVRPGEGYPQ